MAEGKIYVATQGGLCQLPDGRWVTLTPGVTRVREGHPLLKGREDMFRVLDVHFDLEDARSAPEQEKPVPKAEQPVETVETVPQGDAEKPAGLTSGDAPAAPRRGRQRVQKTGD